MTMGHRINQHDPEPTSTGFSDSQFAELVRLLTPIHKAAVLMLEHIEREDAPKPNAPTATINKPDPDPPSSEQPFGE